MNGDIIQSINEAERRGREYTDKSHTAISGTMSKFFGQLTIEMKEVKDAIIESSKDRLMMNTKLDSIERNTKETNGRVHKLEINYEKIEKEMEKRDSNLEKLVLQKEAYLKMWMLKWMIVIVLLGSFVWIKESRDAIIGILKILL